MYLVPLQLQERTGLGFESAAMHEAVETELSAATASATAGYQFVTDTENAVLDVAVKPALSGTEGEIPIFVCSVLVLQLPCGSQKWIQCLWMVGEWLG